MIMRNETFYNNKNEKIEVEIEEVRHDKTLRSDLMKLWVKKKWMPKFLDKTLYVRTYVYDMNGNCYGKYNPMVRKDNRKINFDWVLEATEENQEKIIEEIKRLANA